MDTPNSRSTAANEHRMRQRQRSQARFWGLGLLVLVGACTVPGAVIGLRPEYPPVGQLFHYGYDFVQVDSLQPTFRWEPFPRKQDLAADPDGVGDLTTATYDLRIWRAGEDYFPSEPAYAKRGLPEASHRIEQPLTPATEYYWTVRARFQINGEPRVTEWGMYEQGQAQLRQHFDDLFPNPLYFRFKTPAR